MTDLRERVARAICRANGLHEDYYSTKNGVREFRWGYFRKDADAAIAIVIEECERAATDAINSCREDGESDLRAARSRVEQAIRAIKESE